MEGNEKDHIKLKAALVFKKIIDDNKKVAEKLKGKNEGNSELITSYRKWEAASGVPIASISEIMSGDRNAAITTLVTLISSLGVSVEEFGRAFDAITESEIREFKKDLLKNKTRRQD